MEAAEKDTSYSIGEALALLQKEFPDVSISKIRFLESKGLIAPERTAAGFRRFSQADIDRLVAILKLQRDQYLPLAVIREQFTGEPEARRGGRRGRTGARARQDQPSLGLDGEDQVEVEVEDPETASRPPAPEPRALRVVQDLDPDPEPPSIEPAEAGPAAQDDQEKAPAPTLSQESGLELLVASTATAFAHVPLVPAQELNRPPTAPAQTVQDGEPPQTEPGEAEAPSAGQSRGRKGRKRSKDDGAVEEAPEAPVEVTGNLTPRDFIAQAGINAAFLAELELYGIVKPTKEHGLLTYDAELVELARVAKSLDALGLGPRHLKSLRVSVEKEFGLIEQLVATQLGAGGTRAKRKAAETARALEEQSERFRRQLLALLVSGLIGDRP